MASNSSSETDEVWKIDARTAIATARKFADEHEARIGWFVLRDLEVTKRAGLSDLAWSGHKEGVTLNELRWFIGDLERFLSEPPDAPRP